MWLQVEEELWEEDFIERCVQELLEEEEQWEWFIPSRDLPPQTVSQLQEQISLLVLDQDVHKDADFDIVVSPPQPIRSWSVVGRQVSSFICHIHNYTSITSSEMLGWLESCAILLALDLQRLM